jgi:hypothetical protein
MFSGGGFQYCTYNDSVPVHEVKLLLPQITILQHYFTRHKFRAAHVISTSHFCIGFTWNLRSVPAVVLGRLSREWLLLVIERSCTS